MTRFDESTVIALHQIHLPHAVELLLKVFVRIGDGWIWVGVALWLFQTLELSAFWKVVLECLTAIAISLILYWPLKLILKRRRPYHSLPGVTSKVPPLDKYSFPSGHTMNNMAVALTLAGQFTTWHTLAVTLAAGIPIMLGILRVAFGVHFLTDIAAGALFGVISHLSAQSLFAWWLS